MDIADAVLKAGCKINLYLEITGLRPDGYHELRTLFLPLDEPADTLRISPGKKGKGIVFDCDRPELRGDSNIVVKACEVFARAGGFKPDINIFLEKKIPAGAGLGGGSSDAAALLRYLNGLAGKKSLSPETMNGLAAGLGADVPFFLDSKPAWAFGIGEKLIPTRVDLDGLTLVLICPPVHVSTAWAYRTWDMRRARGENSHMGSNISQLLTIDSEEDIESVFSSGLMLYNSFEEAVFKSHEELREMKEQALGLGASGALMSGSGASLFALFKQEAPARAFAARAKSKGSLVFSRSY